MVRESRSEKADAVDDCSGSAWLDMVGISSRYSCHGSQLRLFTVMYP